MRGEKGFLILEILIAGLILTSSIAATMYLFRIGFDNLERANVSNTLSSKLPQAINLIKNLNMEDKSGAEDIGEGVTLKWEAKLLDQYRPITKIEEANILSTHELFIYKVDFKLSYKNTSREYKLNVLQSKTSGVSAEAIL